MKKFHRRLVPLGILLGVLGQAKAGQYTYTTIDVPGSAFTELRGINDAGQIVGEYQQQEGSPMHGFLLSNGNFTTIDVPIAKIFTQVFGINDTGQIVGYYQQEVSPQNRLHGFVLSGGTYTTIDVPGQSVTVAIGIDNAGQIVGTTYTPFSGGTTHGFLYSGGSFTTLDDPGAAQTIPSGINDAGQIVGSISMFGLPYPQAFVLSGGGYTPLDVPGAIGTTGYGINDAGQIVGSYLDNGGNRHGFLATPLAVPEPASLTLVGSGFLAMLVYGCRHRKGVTARG